MRLVACSALVTAATAISLQLYGFKSAPGVKADSAEPQYHWPHARGKVGSYSTASFAGPANLTSAFSWSWHHPAGIYHTIVVGGPLIDDQNNLYISAEDGIRKFSPEGAVLWYYAPRGPISTCPSLYQGALYGNDCSGWVFALDMATGREIWAEKKAYSVPGDTGYVEAHDGVVVTGVDAGSFGGATRVLGLDAKDGRTLWEYKSTGVFWNIMPVFPGDGSFIVMDFHGGLYKHALHSATLLWEAPSPLVSHYSFSDGGVMLGPDGDAYTCSNYNATGQPGSKGVLRAYRLQDGFLRWERVLPVPCNSWPVVTPDNSAVIVPTGAFVASPAASDPVILGKFAKTPEEMHAWSLSLGSGERKAYGLPEITAAVAAFSAQTGLPLWSTSLPPYGRYAAAGDEEGVLVRRALGHRDQCLPAQFNAPTLSADGTIYVGRADGKLYAVGQGTGTFSTFAAGAGFLHPGTAWAPGMMAVSSCDGLFVWRY